MPRLAVLEADTGTGTRLQGRVRPIRLYLWSKPSALDRLTLFQHGTSGDWTLPMETDHDYLMQVTAFERRERVHAKGVMHVEWKR